MQSTVKDYLVHPLAVCDSKQIGAGTRIWAFSHVLAGAKIGAQCNLGEHVFVENNVIIGDRCTIKNGVALWDLVSLDSGVFIGPYVAFTNDLRPRAFIRRPATTFLPTRIGRGATIGANATIVCGTTIGEYAFIGAGTVVTKDIPPHALVVGNPGHVAGRVCFCGATLDARDFCPACNRALSRNSEQQAIDQHAANDRLRSAAAA